jgi:hypothetical protein
MGLTAVKIALIAWSLGYGPLGGRVQPDQRGAGQRGWSRAVR